MKKILSPLFAVAAATLLFSCTVKQIENPADNQLVEQQLTFQATMADRNGTKTSSARTSDSMNMEWSAAEKISVFFLSGENGGSQFTSTNTASTDVTTFTGSITAFTGTIENPVNDNMFFAVYPYATTNSYNGTVANVKLNAAQTSKAGSISDGQLPTMARSAGLNLAFYQICAGIGFKVERSNISSLEIRNISGAPIAGNMAVAWDENGKPAFQSIADDSDATDTIVVTPEDGGFFTPGVEYYAVIAPITMTSGLEFKFVTPLGYGIYTHSDALEFVRAGFKGMVNKDNDSSAEWHEETPKSYLKVTEFTVGQPYVIVYGDIALQNNSGSVATYSVEGKVSEGKLSIPQDDAASLEWTVSVNSSDKGDYSLCNGESYVSRQTDTNIIELLTSAGDRAAWTLDGTQIYNKNRDSNKYYLKYSGARWEATTSNPTSNISIYILDDGKTARDLAFAETAVAKFVNAEPFTNALSGETTEVTYETSEATVATVNAATGEVTIVGAGTATITASAPATETLKAGSASFTLTVSKLSQTLTFADEAPEIDLATTPTYTQAVTGAETTVTYSLRDEDASRATINAATGEVTATATGTVQITATAAETDTYTGDSTSYELTIVNSAAVTNTYNKATAFEAGQAYVIVYGNNALKNNGGSVTTYSVEGKVSEGKLSIPQDDAASLEWTVSVNSSDRGEYALCNNESYVSRQTDTNIIELLETPGARAAWTLDGTQIYNLNSGGNKYYLKYSSARWEATTGNPTSEISIYILDDGKTARDLAFAETKVEKLVTDVPFTNALSGVTTEVTYETSEATVATVNAATGEVTIVGAGTATITASAPANETLKAGTASFTLTVSKLSQTLTFTEATPEIDLANTTTYTQAVTGAETTVTYSLRPADASKASIVAETGEVTATAKGTVQVTATAEATAIYAAASASYTLTIANSNVQDPYYELVTAEPKSWDGTYLIASAASGSAVIFNYQNASGYSAAGTAVSIADGKIDSSENIDACAVTVSRYGTDPHAADGTLAAYDIQVANDKYLYRYNSKIIQDSEYQGNRHNQHTFLYDNGVRMMYAGNTSNGNKYYFHVNGSSFTYESGSTSNRVYFFKKVE